MLKSSSRKLLLVSLSFTFFTMWQKKKLLNVYYSECIRKRLTVDESVWEISRCSLRDPVERQWFFIFLFLELINLSGNLKPQRIIIQKIYLNRTPSEKAIDRRVIGIDLFVDTWVCLFFTVGVFIKKCVLLQIHIHPHTTHGLIILEFRFWKSQLLKIS